MFHNKKENPYTWPIKYASGAASGLISTFVFHPIDALRIRTFLNPHNIGSISSLTNGISFNIVSSIAKNFLTFPVREKIYATLLNQQYSQLKADFMSSLITGTLIGIISTPINVIKVPMQNNHQQPKLIPIIQNIYNHYGLKGFYRGGVATFLRDILWTSIYFPIFDTINHISMVNTYIDQRIIASSFAALCATTVAYPFDGIRLFRQRNDTKALTEYNFWHGFKLSFALNKHNGKSYLLAITRVSFATTISHMSYLYISEYLTKKIDI